MTCESEITTRAGLTPEPPGLPPALPVTRWYGRAMLIFTIAAAALISHMVLISSFDMYGYWSMYGLELALAVVLLSRVRNGAWLTALSDRRWLLMVGGAALAVRLFAVLWIQCQPSADFAVYHKAGITMANNWTLGVPAAGGESTLRAFFPPGQVFAMGVVYRLFNSGQTLLAAGDRANPRPELVSPLPAQFLNVLWATLTVIGVWYLAKKMFGDKVARVASIMAALFPSTVFGCSLLGAEVHQTFWFILALCLYVAAVERAQSGIGGFASGLGLGLATLVRPTFLLVPAALGLHMVLAWPARRLKGAFLAAMMAGGVAAVVVPWTFRNYLVTGGFLLISSNGGINLYSANNDQAQGAYTESASIEVYEEAKARRLNDVEFNRLGMEKAKAWIKANPGKFARLALRKMSLFWETDKEIAWWAMEQPMEFHTKDGEICAAHPERDPGETARLLGMSVSQGFYAACIIFGLLGMIAWRRRLGADRVWMFIPVLFTYFTAIHMVFESQGKYHYMLAPLIGLMAALAAVKPAAPAARGGPCASGMTQ